MRHFGCTIENAIKEAILFTKVIVKKYYDMFFSNPIKKKENEIERYILSDKLQEASCAIKELEIMVKDACEKKKYSKELLLLDEWIDNAIVLIDSLIASNTIRSITED